MALANRTDALDQHLLRPNNHAGNLMTTVFTLLLAAGALAAEPLRAGNQTRTLDVNGEPRTYLVHAPPRFNPQQPTPIVLILHGAGMTGPMMASYCGMNAKADQAGFVAVYPSATGHAIVLAFNAGAVIGQQQPDDVKYLAAVLDELSGAMQVDPRRIYATGMSNGGMMCYRLASEMAGRIAAIAPVAGTMAEKLQPPTRAVPILHIHGTNDRLVPIAGASMWTRKIMAFQSLTNTIDHWVKTNECPQQPTIEELPDRVADETRVSRQTYGPGTDGSEVVLLTIEGGGHTWPGRKPGLALLGRSTYDISANDLIWEFFERHPLPEAYVVQVRTN